jgi:hypothetical protein
LQIFKEKKGTFCLTDTSRLFSPKILKTKNNKIVQIASKQTLVSQSKLKPTCPTPKIPNCYPQTTHYKTSNQKQLNQPLKQIQSKNV